MPLNQQPPLVAPVPYRPPQDPLPIQLPTIEEPAHELYYSAWVEELKSDSDESLLLQEVRGQRVVPVHGVGIWSCSVKSNMLIEEMKQRLWSTHGSRDGWLAGARARTTHYARPGSVRPPLRWVLVEDGSIPSNALQTGTEKSGEKLYSARAWFAGGVHLGKAGSHLQPACSLSYNSLEHPIQVYEVLVGNSAYVRWIDIPRAAKLTLDSFDGSGDLIPVEGGREGMGTSLFVAQGEYEDGWHPGKAALGDDHCCLGYGGGECWLRPFRILCWDLDETSAFCK